MRFSHRPKDDGILTVTILACDMGDARRPDSRTAVSTAPREAKDIFTAVEDTVTGALILEWGDGVNASRDQIEDYIVSKLVELSQDWDNSASITPDSMIFTELGFESLDAVILGVTIQEYFACQMPFAELLAELGEQRRDLRVNELIDFVHRNLLRCSAEARPASSS